MLAYIYLLPGFPGGSVGTESHLQCRRPGFNPWVRKIPWRREWLLTSVFLPGEFHEQRSLAVYSPWGHKELDMAEWLTPTYLPPDLFSRITQAFGASIRSSDGKLNQTKRTENLWRVCVCRNNKNGRKKKRERIQTKEADIGVVCVSVCLCVCAGTGARIVEV